MVSFCVFLIRGICINGLDISAGQEKYGSDSAYLEVLRAYYLHTPALLEKIASFGTPISTKAGNLVSKGNLSLADYAVIVHGLKGSHYSICAGPAAEEAAKLETAAKAGELEKVLTDSGSFIKMIESLLLEIGNLLQKAAAQKTKQRLSIPDTALFSKLLEAANGYRANAIEAVLKELESCEYESGGELIIWLRRQMDNLEYDAIRQCLEAPNPFEYIENGGNHA
ncbi:hypothetical protein AGMMS50230_02460 [Spirochaetia bacterium]|nr:hypothetical protein AGMMS50230_02460 [Spirochaetia bacterium]